MGSSKWGGSEHMGGSAWAADSVMAVGGCVDGRCCGLGLWVGSWAQLEAH